MAFTMTTMESHGGFPYYETGMSQQTSNLFGPQQGWASALCGGKSVTPGRGFLNYPASNAPPSENDLQLPTKLPGEELTTRLGKQSHDLSIQAPSMYTDTATTTADLSSPDFATAGVAMYSSASMFNAANVTANDHETPTVSPLETRFDLHSVSEPFNSSFSFQSPPQSLEGQAAMQYPTAPPHVANKRRCDSPDIKYSSSSPVRTPSLGGRRRRSENVEPGSTRAIYLEKNRKAASKCRSKQKMQQEDLVETARDVERRNRYLKTEVEMLKGGIRELMEIVGQHNGCEDSRLRDYVQRKADRLGSGPPCVSYVPPQLSHAKSASSSGSHIPDTPSSGKS